MAAAGRDLIDFAGAVEAKKMEWELFKPIGDRFEIVRGHLGADPWQGLGRLDDQGVPEAEAHTVACMA